MAIIFQTKRLRCCVCGKFIARHALREWTDAEVMGDWDWWLCPTCNVEDFSRKDAVAVFGFDR